VVAALSPIFPFSLALGLPPMQIVLLTLTLLITTITLGSGRATVMQGAIHLVLFASFLFLTVVP
jgi:Ca2+:H+ antiporter